MWNLEFDDFKKTFSELLFEVIKWATSLLSEVLFNSVLTEYKIEVKNVCN